MMHQQIIARRYAKGLMLSATDQDLDGLTQNLKSLNEVLLGEQYNLRRLFEDPSFSHKERKAVIKRIADQMEMNPMIAHFLMLLVNKDRILLLPQICEEAITLIDEHHGRQRASIKSATPLHEDMINEICSLLNKISKKNVRAEIMLDPDLIGGIRVEMGGTVFDGSVKARLSSIKNKLVYNASM
jgi:F-type H+-transporting ATPase subunit delta